MKNTVLTILFIITISFSGLAQSKNPEKSAQWAADRMTELLALNEVDAKKVYEIQLEKNLRLNEAYEKYGNDEDDLKKAKKPIYANINKRLQDVIGNDGMAKWNLFIKSRKN